MGNIEMNRSAIVSRLEEDGWELKRHGAKHDVYAHPTKPGLAMVPRHRTLSPGVARNIHDVAGWL